MLFGGCVFLVATIVTGAFVPTGISFVFEIGCVSTRFVSNIHPFRMFRNRYLTKETFFFIKDSTTQQDIQLYNNYSNTPNYTHLYTNGTNKR